MIDPKELRLGNLVQYQVNKHTNIYDQSWSVLSVLVIDDVLCLGGELTLFPECNLKDVEPIPITPEWINRFETVSSYRDTVKICEIYEDHSRIKIKYNYYGENDISIEQYGEGEHRLPHIKHVHQLQNLIYALTGQELTVKQPEMT